MNIGKNLGFLLMVMLILPSMGWAQDDAQIAIDGIPHGVTLQELSEAHILEDGLDQIRRSIITGRQDLAVATDGSDKLKIKAAKKQLVLDWRNYRVQRAKLKKLTGFDYQDFNYSGGQPPLKGPPPIITLQKLREKRIIEDRIKLIRQSIINDRIILDNATNAGDVPKIEATQGQLAQDFREYKEQKTELTAMEAEIDPNGESSKKNGHKRSKKDKMG